MLFLWYYPVFVELEISHHDYLVQMFTFKVHKKISNSVAGVVFIHLVSWVSTMTNSTENV